jgi:hypothetical protein
MFFQYARKIEQIPLCPKVLTLTIRSEPGWKAQTTHQSEMAHFNECTKCAHIMFDMADIVIGGDVATFWRYRTA